MRWARPDGPYRCEVLDQRHDFSESAAMWRARGPDGVVTNRPLRRAVVLGACLLALPSCTPPTDADIPAVVPNDNRIPAGTRAGNVVRLDLEARLAGWRPDLDVDSAVTVQVFAEAGGKPSIPGPLLRALQGSEIHVTIRNVIPDSTLVVYGFGSDTLRIPPGSRFETRYTADRPGTFLYWGTTSGSAGTVARTGRDAQLTGAIVIDPAGVEPDPRERIFVMTVIDILPDSTKPGPAEDIWELAINGLSWPHSERLAYDVGDTIRWRWLNGSYLPHPMHLHGFHFRVLSKGDGRTDTRYTAGDVRTVVTEHMTSGTTMSLEWVPTRAGNWLFHCHMAPHITPFPERPDSVRAHDALDVVHHATTGMAGLVLGIVTTLPATAQAEASPPASRHVRLFAQAAHSDSTRPRAHGYAIALGAEAAPDSMMSPGPALVLTRGQTTAITVINLTDEHTTVHWHGMELESVFDGVAGWSGAGSNTAPLIAPGDSFAVAFTPPRTGTFIYHTHMDETAQLATGMYGPLLVLEPGERFDPTTDIVLMIGGAVDGDSAGATINGRRRPLPRTLRTGATYRLRLINILTAEVIGIRLLSGTDTLTWTPVSKDGAAIPATRQRSVPATLRMGVGETYDFAWTPRLAGAVELVVDVTDAGQLRQGFRVR